MHNIGQSNKTTERSESERANSGHNTHPHPTPPYPRDCVNKRAAFIEIDLRQVSNKKMSIKLYTDHPLGVCVLDLLMHIMHDLLFVELFSWPSFPPRTPLLRCFIHSAPAKCTKAS